jgi:hypothetical protein
MLGTATYLKSVTAGTAEGRVFRVDPPLPHYTTNDLTSGGVTDRVIVVPIAAVEPEITALLEEIPGYTAVYPYGKNAAGVEKVLSAIPLHPVGADDDHDAALANVGYAADAYEVVEATEVLDDDGLVVSA